MCDSHDCQPPDSAITCVPVRISVRISPARERPDAASRRQSGHASQVTDRRLIKKTGRLCPASQVCLATDFDPTRLSPMKSGMSGRGLERQSGQSPRHAIESDRESSSSVILRDRKQGKSESRVSAERWPRPTYVSFLRHNLRIISYSRPTFPTSDLRPTLAKCNGITNCFIQPNWRGLPNKTKALAGGVD